MAIPRPRPRSQDTLAETERAPLPVLPKPASTDEGRSILIWGTPIRIDPTWEELFAGRDRRAELIAGPNTVGKLPTASARHIA